MKLLLDENLSYKLAQLLCDEYPDSTHVMLLDMEGASDEQIWAHAKEEGYIIVTQDADFHEYSLLYGGPPLVVWLRCGNQSKTYLLEKLQSSRSIIEAAALDPDIWSLKIY